MSLGQVAYEEFFGAWAEWKNENESYRKSWAKAAEAVVKAIAEMPKCARCNGSGVVSVRSGTNCETDSPAERAANRYDAKCKECLGLGKRKESDEPR